MTVATWLIPFEDLTPDQVRAVELPTDRHRIIAGPAGSGKTQVLVHRAAYLRRTYAVPDDRFRVFIFTNALKDYIRSGLSTLDLPVRNVSTFDSWCVEFYRTHIRRRLPMDSEGKKYDFAAIRSGVLSYLDSRREAPALDFVLVDEGQDLPRESYLILRKIARHVTVCVDASQRLYEDGAGIEEINEILGTGRSSLDLLAAYRNSPDVAMVASYFIADQELRRQYIAQAKGLSIEPREWPLLYVASSPDREIDRLADVVSGCLKRNKRVGIIVAQRSQVYGFATALGERGIDVEKAVPPRFGRRTDSSEQVDFESLTPKIASYHAAKGLTFDCVCLPRLTTKSFRDFESDTRLRMLFVGVARATSWVYLSTIAGQEVTEIERLRQAARDGHLVIQEESKQEGPEGHDVGDSEEEEVWIY